MDHPPSSGLDEIYGYVATIRVEQMDNRDQVWLNLSSYTQRWSGALHETITQFGAYLDVGTTVVLAQLQLLREANVRGLPVKLRFLDDREGQDRQDPSGNRWFYSVVLYPVLDATLPSTVLEDGSLALTGAESSVVVSGPSFPTKV